MKIRKATNKDFEEYYSLKKEEEKEYSLIIGEKIRIPSKKDLKKELLEIISNKNKISYVVIINDKLVAYMNAVFNKTIWSNSGYIEDLFVKKEFRRNGVATKLIKEFIILSKSRKLRKIFLSVNIKNKNAIKLYENIGFRITKYDMEKKLK